MVSEEDYVAFAVEANENTTFYHRDTSDIVLFAPDQECEKAVSLDDAPERTLYRLEGVRDLRDWIETVASQWPARVET